MLKIKTTLDIDWSANLRPRVGESAIYQDRTWVNRTGYNGEPGATPDWDSLESADDYIIPFGSLITYKASGNTNNSAVEAGDSVMGQLNGGLFMTRGTYVTGNILDLASYSNPKYFDQN